MKDITSRPNVAEDFAACLAIFDSNVPTFFAPEGGGDPISILINSFGPVERGREGG